MEIDAGMVASMMEDPPHVGADSTDIENIIQRFVYPPLRRNGVVVAIVRDVQQKEGLRDCIQQVEADEPPRIRLEDVKGNPAARQHRQPHGDFNPHGEVGLGRDILVGKEILKAAAQDFGEGRLGGRVENGVPQGGLRWCKVIDLRSQTNNRLFGFTGTMISGRPDASRPGLPRVDKHPPLAQGVENRC